MLNSEIAFIVNPITWELKKGSNQFIQSEADGTYTESDLPYKEKPITSYAVPENKAILGNPKNYLLAAAGSFGLNMYDQTLAIEDMDLFVGKSFVDGVAKHPNAFVVLDLSSVNGGIMPSL